MNKKFLLLNLAIAFTLCLSCPLKASGKDGECAFLKEDNEHSPFLHHRRVKANQSNFDTFKPSDVEEQFNEGLSKFNQNNYAEAFNCFTEAAQAGHGGAQYNLGLCYEFGVGVKSSFKDAIIWYSLAAANKNEKAIQKIKYFSQHPS